MTSRPATVATPTSAIIAIEIARCWIQLRDSRTL
jgi:hypothetical protein